MWTGTTPPTAPHRRPAPPNHPRRIIRDRNRAPRPRRYCRWELMGYHGYLWASMEFNSKEMGNTMIGTVDGLLPPVVAPNESRSSPGEFQRKLNEATKMICSCYVPAVRNEERAIDARND